MIVFVIVPPPANTIVVVDSLWAILGRSDTLGSLHGGGKQTDDLELAKESGLTSIIVRGLKGFLYARWKFGVKTPIIEVKATARE